MKRIVIEVTRREMGVLAHYALKLAARNLNESGGWRSASNLLREAADTVYFQVDDKSEENELRQQGVEVRNGMAFMDPRRAMAMMNSMAQDDSQFKDVPTIMSLVRKIAARLGRPAPKVVGGQGEQAPGETPVDSRGANVPGVDKAKYAETQPMPDLQSQEEFERMQQRMYSPTAQAHGLQPQSPPAAPALTPAPGTVGTFQPRPKMTARVRDVPQTTGATVDPRTWSQEVENPQFARAKLSPQAAARGQNYGSGINTMGDTTLSQKEDNLIDKEAVAQAPEEDPTKWDLEEAYRLLGIRKPRWRVKNV